MCSTNTNEIAMTDKMINFCFSTIFVFRGMNKFSLLARKMTNDSNEFSTDVGCVEMTRGQSGHTIDASFPFNFFFSSPLLIFFPLSFSLTLSTACDHESWQHKNILFTNDAQSTHIVRIHRIKCVVV